MYGVVTRNEGEVDWSPFDRGFYEVKDVTGRPAEPLSNAVNMVSCFGDNRAAADDPDLVPVNDVGEPANRDRDYFDWAYVCPTHDAYREGLLEIVEDCAAVGDDVRLDDVGFPREGYCRCDRCERRFAESDHEDWYGWRASVITGFVAEASARIPGRTYLTLYPDPYPGHLRRRAGIDLDALTTHVDEFVVPLYDTSYGTTYWLETVARGFQSALGWKPEGPDAEGVAGILPSGESVREDGTPFSIELYAVEVDVDELIHATEVAEAYANDVFFGYDANNAAAAIRRKGAEGRDGVTHGSPADETDGEN